MKFIVVWEKMNDTDSEPHKGNSPSSFTNVCYVNVGHGITTLNVNQLTI